MLNKVIPPFPELPPKNQPPRSGLPGDQLLCNLVSCGATLAYSGTVQISRTDPKGQVTNYTYDNRNRLKAVSYSGATSENRDYTYDASGNILSVTEMSNAADTNVFYTYDALNRVATELSTGTTHRYRYDLAGNRRETVYGSGGSNPRTLVSTYDALNRTATITEGGRTTTYRYDIAGNTRETVQPNGDSIRRSYDALGRQTAIIGPGGVASELYVTLNTYDAFGNLKRIAETYPSGNLTARTILNTYDNANRLLVESISWGSGGPAQTQTAYTYDAANNRTAKTVTVGGVPTSQHAYTYNTLNQLLSAIDASNGATTKYTYDRNGNRISSIADRDGNGVAEKNVRYVYDRENRLVELVQNAVEPQKINIYPGLNDKTYPQLATQATYYKVTDSDTYRYAYDYRTRRVLRDESAAGGTTAQLVFSGGTYVREYESGSPAPSAEFIRGSDYGGGIGGLLYSLRGNTPSFKHYNSRGDVVAATDGNSSLTYQAAYEAFGRHGDTASSEEWGTNPDRQQANTKDQDPTGLLNEGFRYRDLETGTFITRDPLGFVDGPNVYTYVVQNPWTKFDPLGLKFEVEGTYDADEKGNRSYYRYDDNEQRVADTEKQRIWDGLQKIRNSRFYKGSDFQKMDQDERVVNIEFSAKATNSTFNYGRGINGTIIIDQNGLDGLTMMPGKGGKMIVASTESLIVHEGQHAFDFNIASEGNRDVYEEKYDSLFALPRDRWNDYPNPTEYNAVSAANAYRGTVGEDLRSRYNLNTGQKGLQETVRYHNPSNQTLRKSNLFKRKLDEYNRSNPNNPLVPSRILRGEF